MKNSKKSPAKPNIMSILTIRPAAKTHRPYKIVFASSCERSISVPMRPNSTGSNTFQITPYMSATGFCQER
jgi:hypothetical protein